MTLEQIPQSSLSHFNSGTSTHSASGTRLAARLGSLTQQQWRVLEQLQLGRANKQIAYDLGLGESTVKAHISNILQKLGVHSRTQVVVAIGKIDADELRGPTRHCDRNLSGAEPAAPVNANRRQLEDRLAALTPRQIRVLQMLCDGRFNKEIAYDLAISEATVKAHVSAILRKLRVFSRTQAVQMVSAHQRRLREPSITPDAA